MSFKDRLLGIQLEEQELKAYERAKEARERAKQEELVDRYPFYTDVENAAALEIADEVAFNVKRALGDFAEVMWGDTSIGYLVEESKHSASQIGEHACLSWFAASRVKSEGHASLRGHSDVTDVAFVVLNIVGENEYLPEWIDEKRKSHCPENLKWKKSTVRFQVPIYDKPSHVVPKQVWKLSNHIFVPVVQVAGMGRTVYSFGYSKDTYITNVERGLEMLIKVPDTLKAVGKSYSQTDNSRG